MGGGASKTVQTTTQELSPEQRQLLEGVIPIAQQTLKNPPKQFPGTAIAGVTPAELQARQMMMSSANGMAGLTNQLPGRIQSIAGQQGANVGQIGAESQVAQQQLMQMMAAMFGGTTGQMAAGNAQTGTALDFLLNPDILNAQSNPYLQSYMDASVRPLTQQFANTILPGISQDAISAGGFGGSRQGIAEGLASQGLQQATGDITSRIGNEGYAQGLGAMISGLGAANTQQGQNLTALNQMFGTGIQGMLGGQQNRLASTGQQQQGLASMMQGLSQTPGILDAMIKPAEMVSAVGAQQRAEKQAVLTEQIQKYISKQMMPFTVAQDVAAMAFGMPGGTTNSTGTTTGGGPGALEMGLGVMSALPALLGLFGLSDRRLKTNIKQLGKLRDGLQVYSFKLVGEVIEQIGLMADEVIKLYPQAVKCDRDGYLRVAYNLVPTWKEKLECGNN